MRALFFIGNIIKDFLHLLAFNFTQNIAKDEFTKKKGAVIK